MNLTNITLVCATCNRHKLLLNNAEYWNEVGDIKVIYADGSKEPCLELINKYENIKYLHLPDKNLQERYKISVDNSITKYSCISCDDDFYFPSALEECLHFLEMNNDYSACIGNAIGFTKIFGKIVLIPYGSFNGRHLSDTKASDRVIKHFSDYQPTHNFSLVRTNVLKKVFSVSIDLEVFAIEEIFIEFIIASLGRSIVLNNIYLMRNRGIPAVLTSTNKSQDRSILISDWWIGATTKEKEKEFLDKIVCANNNAINKKDIVLALEEYISKPKTITLTKSLFIKLFKNNFKHLKKFIYFFFIIKNKAYNFIKYSYFFYFNKKILNSYIRQGMSLNLNEYRRIEKFINKQI